MIRPYHWILALGLALAVHLIALGLVLTHEPAEGARAPGEQGIEIDLGMLGDLGAQAQNQQAARPEQAVETPVDAPPPETEKPVAQPVPEPEAVVAKQTPELTVKPKPKPQPEPKPEAANPAATNPAPVAASAPEQASSDTGTDSNDSRRKTTGSQNAQSSGGNPGAKQSYYALVAARLAQHKRYPVRARRKGEEGTARLFFILNNKGSVIEYKLTESSGFKSLDRAVVEMLKSASPLPPFPADMKMETLSINIPVAFSIN